MIYKGYIIRYTYGYYSVYDGDEFICTADTVQEAKREIDGYVL